MATEKLEVAPSTPTPPDLKALLGPPPLLDGEDADVFDALYNHIRSAIAPRDFIEEICARDFVDYLWETLRLRRLKVKLIKASAHEGLERLLRPLTGSIFNNQLVEAWARCEPAATKEVDALLKQAGLDKEAVAAQTLEAKLDTFERIERMVMQSEARRNVMRREIDRHREFLARRLAEVATQTEDEEFREIPRLAAAE